MKNLLITKIKLCILSVVVASLFSTSAMSSVVPNIIKIGVTPEFATKGSKFTFSAELNDPLPPNYKIKVRIGKNIQSMVGSNINYSLQKTIYTTGLQTYQIGVYNSKNVLQNKSVLGTYTVTNITNHTPILSLLKADENVTVNTPYVLTFSPKDDDFNLSSITIDWGDSTSPETLNLTSNEPLTINHTYTKIGEFLWNAYITDKGVPVLSSKTVSGTASISEPVLDTLLNPPLVIRSTGFSKIANDGSILADSAKLGTNSKDWACTKDNVTGLIWEIKSNDGSFRDMKKVNVTTWFEPFISNNGNAGVTNGDGFSDTNAYSILVNEQSLCSLNNWRLPTLNELLSIAKPGKTPAIETLFFPDISEQTESRKFWTRSVYGSGGGNALFVDFNTGLAPKNGKGKGAHYNIRLISGLGSLTSSNITTNVKNNDRKECLQKIKVVNFAMSVANIGMNGFTSAVCE